ncbi:hypothetical protein [Candidatus Binatus soli]|jgi:hypothetical protein|uniref:hypothetical protein n=1 Tax=Candidatus Binatus soli TaxID=1953413 RepID=UPI003D0B46C5
MELRRILGIIAGAIGILLVCCLPASANDLCFTLGSNVYFTSVSIPSKNQCETFSLAAKAPSFPGYLATGSMCLSSNGTTVLLNLSDGYFNGTESIQGTFNKNTGAGTVSDCTAPEGNPNKCSTADVTVKTCATQSIPAAEFDPAPKLVNSSVGD